MRICLTWYGRGQTTDILRLRCPDGTLRQFRSGATIPADLVATLPAALLREIAAEGFAIDLDDVAQIAQRSTRSMSDFSDSVGQLQDSERQRRFDLLIANAPGAAAAIAGIVSKE